MKGAFFFFPRLSVRRSAHRRRRTRGTGTASVPCCRSLFTYRRCLFFCSSETSELNQGLLIEVWCKGMLWDRAMGYCFIPLQTIMYEMVSRVYRPSSVPPGSGPWVASRRQQEHQERRAAAVLMIQ